MDHRLGAGGEGLVVAGQAAVHLAPTDTPLHHPAPLHDLKAAALRIPVDDFDVESEDGAVFDDGILEAGVDPALRDGWIPASGS
ncbi:hypothetical protein ACE1SV_62360 [Streptomyces sennicomposti]